MEKKSGLQKWESDPQPSFTPPAWLLYHWAIKPLVARWLWVLTSMQVSLGLIVWWGIKCRELERLTESHRWQHVIPELPLGESWLPNVIPMLFAYVPLLPTIHTYVPTCVYALSGLMKRSASVHILFLSSPYYSSVHVDLCVLVLVVDCVYYQYDLNCWS